MLENNPQADPESGQSVNNDPQGGQSSGNNQPSAAPSNNIPENLKGKSAEDLVKMYGEAERKLGQQGSEVGELRKYKEQMDVVLDTIYKNPDLYKSVESAMTKQNQPQQPAEQADQTNSADAETRQVVEGQIINQFADRAGLNDMSPEDKQKTFTGIANEIVDMYDPTRRSQPSEIIKKLPLSSLNKILDKAYTLYQKTSGVETNPRAEIGSVASGSLSSPQGKGLTEEEKSIARKQGVSEEDYLKNKTLLINRG